MNKADVRAVMKAKRNELSDSERQIKDRIIFNNVINDSIFNSSNIMFIYVSFKNEADTHNIIDYALRKGKIVCVPEVNEKTRTMKALKIDSLKKNMHANNYGILEPDDSAAEIPGDKIDLVLVPGLAFDLMGGRLGYGGGYYDRFLRGMRKDALKIGLAYDFQIVQEVPTESFDVLINGLITESRVEKW